MAAAYSAYYTHGNASGVSEPPRSAWRKYRSAQRNAYLNARYGYELTPAASHILPWLSRERRQRFDKYVCFLPYAGKGARLLDVGCGNGRLMLQLQAVGWQVCGVEPDPRSSAQARAAGLDVRDSIEEDAWPESYFDAIVMNHVIEHLQVPLETLSKCRRTLKPGGQISVATPNFASLGHQIFGRHWVSLDAPRHLILFTPGSLRRLLESAGFEADPGVRPRFLAQSIFRHSMRIRCGQAPFQKTPKLSLGASLKTQWLAMRANRRTAAHPELGEELVLLARRRV